MLNEITMMNEAIHEVVYGFKIYFLKLPYVTWEYFKIDEKYLFSK